MYKKMMKYAKEHPVYIATTHAIGGVGLGFLLSNWGYGNAMWGWVLIGLAVVMHLYAWMQ